MKAIVTTVHKASPIGSTSVPDMVIKAEAEMPDIMDVAPGWEQRAREGYERDGRLVADALFQHLPGGTVDQILRALLERRASLLRVKF